MIQPSSKIYFLLISFHGSAIFLSFIVFAYSIVPKTLAFSVVAAFDIDSYRMYVCTFVSMCKFLTINANRWVSALLLRHGSCYYFLEIKYTSFAFLLTKLKLVWKFRMPHMLSQIEGLDKNLTWNYNSEQRH